MDLVVLDQGIDASAVVGRIFFQILGAIAEFEHALVSKRTRDGLAAARARGARTGGQTLSWVSRRVAVARAVYDEVGADGKRLHGGPDRRRVRRQQTHHLPHVANTSAESPAPQWGSQPMVAE